ncbi:MAG: monovalent cation/H(+) antiporter subunit G [Bacillota bacterium]|nr:monovalent cation/H(+) antiporter subunit G [Bacillota bacterium]
MIYRIIMDIFFAVGIFFTISGILGILRMPDTYCRLQYASSIMTMGCGPVLIGTAIFGFSTGNTDIAFKALAAFFFILIIYPAVVQRFIKAAYKNGAKIDSRTKVDDYGRDKLNE